MRKKTANNFVCSTILTTESHRYISTKHASKFIEEENYTEIQKKKNKRKNFAYIFNFSFAYSLNRHID